MKTGDQSVLFRDRGGIRIVTLNRPRALNALDQNMIDILYDNYSRWQDAPMVSGIFIKGEGKAFCAGGDVKAVTTRYRAGEKEDVMNFFRREYSLNNLIATMKTPYVAFMDGVTMGGGAGISVHGHYRIATEKTLFAMPECALGLFTDVGATHFLTHVLPYELGVYMAMTGARLGGKELTAVGIATHFVPSFKLDQLEERLGDVRWSGKDVEKIGMLLDDIADPWEDVQLVQKKPEGPILKNQSEIMEVFSLETVEEIRDELNKRAQNGSEWCQQAHKAIVGGSPTSLKVTFEALRRSRNLPLAESLQMEYRMLYRFMEGNDFYEGVRSILVDKDNKPSFQPSRLEDISREMVLEYFKPLTEIDELELPAPPRSSL